MKTTAVLLPSLAALARASPLIARQDIDFDLVNSAPDPSTVSIPIGPTAQSVTYNLASATAAATATPIPVEAVEKRGIIAARSACDALPVGAGPTPTPDTAEAFLDYYLLSNAAIDAEVPTGYEQTFSNLQASSSAYGYLGYTTLSSYDTAAAVTQCDSITGCLGFNIFFERDPSVETGTDCPNPPSTTVIKAVFWGGYVEAANANNTGQWRNDFHVVIAGSNGYMKTSIPAVPGFNGEALGDASISAPDNCAGQNTYMGSKIFTTSVFDPNLCAAACASQSEYNTAHPPRRRRAHDLQVLHHLPRGQERQPRGPVLRPTLLIRIFLLNMISFCMRTFFCCFSFARANGTQTTTTPPDTPSPTSTPRTTTSPTARSRVPIRWS